MIPAHPDECTIKDCVKEYWDKNSEFYDKHGLGTEEECLQWQEDFADIIGRKPLKILDVGTGTGFIGLNLARLGHEVTGLDISEKMMAHARRKAVIQNIRYTFVVGDAENTGFPDNEFDAVVCRYLLWTLPNPEKAFSEWIRVAKPGGTIMVIDGQWVPKGMKQKSCLLMLRLYKRFCMKSDTFQLRYSRDISQGIPNFTGVKLENLLSYFKSHSLSDISIRDFRHIRDIQKKHLPWFLKYAFDDDTYGVWGSVAKEKDERSVDLPG